MTRDEGLCDVLLLGELALREGPEGVHDSAAEHRGGVRVLSTRVGIDLRVEHQELHVGSVL